MYTCDFDDCQITVDCENTVLIFKVYVDIYVLNYITVKLLLIFKLL